MHALPGSRVPAWLDSRGNPQARNLFEFVAYLRQAKGVRFEVCYARAAERLRRRCSPKPSPVARRVSVAGSGV